MTELPARSSGSTFCRAARRDGLRIGVFIVHQLIGILGHRFDFASTPLKDPEFPFSRSEPNEGEVSAAYLYTSAKGNRWLCGSDR